MPANYNIPPVPISDGDPSTDSFLRQLREAVLYLFQTYTTESDQVNTTDYWFEVAQGNVPGVTVADEFGRNPNIGTGTTPEDVWAPGGVYTGHPVGGSAETVEVFSSDSGDTDGGTGARVIRLVGLDANWADAEETLVLNGVTPVASTGTWHRVSQAYVTSAGSNEFNLGTITCRHTTTTANVFFIMPVDSNQTHVAAYTVPAGKTGYIRTAQFEIARTSGSGGSATVELETREFGGAWRDRIVEEVTTASPIVIHSEGFIVIQEKADVRVRVSDVSDNNTVVSAEFAVILKDNN